MTSIAKKGAMAVARSLAANPPHNRNVQISALLTFPHQLADFSESEIGREHWRFLQEHIGVFAALASRPSMRLAHAACPMLEDPLQDFAVLDCLPNKTAVKDKSELERKCVVGWLASGRPLLGDSVEGFVSNLVSVNEMATGQRRQIRAVPVGVRRDNSGNQISYPDQSWCIPLLRRLHTFVQDGANESTLFATVLFAGIIHAHPFTDGNGRTARICYNILLSERLKRQIYLPISLMERRNYSAFLIKLRRAIYRGEWLPLQQFFSGVSCVAARMTRKCDCVKSLKC